MTRGSHCRLLGVLLVIFSLLNIAVGIGMLYTIPFAEFAKDPSGHAIARFIYAIVCASIGFFVGQLVSAIIFQVSGHSRTWGLIASVLAILGGFGLPVGVYGLILLAPGASTTEVG